MALKTGLFSLALGALLLGSTAQAADARTEHDASSVVAQDFRGPRYGHPTSNRSGRYELQMVTKWVAGRYEQVWVAEDCSDRSRRYIMKCQEGHYEQRWVPGHYEKVQEWVWVPAPRHGYRPA